MSASPPSANAAAWFGIWGWPVDRPGQIALAMACALLVVAAIPGGPRQLAAVFDLPTAGDTLRLRRLLVAGSLIAAFLSIGYVDAYLRGGPRAPGASLYWLQGRALSHGSFSWTLPIPGASYRTTGLLATVSGKASGIFAPGYPLLLAAGFLIGAPMLVGPILAAGLVLSTWLLASELARPAPGTRDDSAHSAAGVAAALSIICVALRQQTADVLPYGAAGLAISLALAFAFRGERTARPALFAVSGVAIGWLASGLPASAPVVAVVAVLLAFRTAKPGRSVSYLCAAALPGIILVLVANRSATGSAFASALSLYERSFGSLVPPSAPTPGGIVRAVAQAREHLMDVANFEPLALIAVVPLVSERRRSMRVASLAFVVVAACVTHVVTRGDAVSAQSSRFAEVLPLEHALIGLGVATGFGRAYGRAATTMLGLALGGFALHAAHSHEKAAENGLGRPAFETDVLQNANALSGLVLFDDDSAFQLADAMNAPSGVGIRALRARGDDHDRLAYDLSGRPSARRYLVSPTHRPTLVPWSPSSPGASFWRFEAESDWPPIGTSGGVAAKLDVTESCASAASVLTLTPAGTSDASLLVELPLPPATMTAPGRSLTVTPRAYALGRPASGVLDLVAMPGSPPLAHWTWLDDGHGHTCVDLASSTVELERAQARLWLVLKARGGAIAFDRTLVH
jgi:hypothetical protein